MKLLKTLGLVLCSAFLFSTLSSKAQTLDPTQVYTTGNIVQGTPQGGPTPWVGGVYQDNLTCWYGGDPGYCGPSGIVRPGNFINFSYGSSYLYQQQLVSSLLPSATGLQVGGYNFTFTAKNGNGWDDGRTDNLMALVRLWDNTGGRGATNLLYGNAYSLNYKFNWTTFNYSETFTTPLAVPSIGQVQYGFIGKDNNGWAGPYGPEVRDISFSLKYKVDPCASNVLSSPTCPGYLEALAKLAPPAPTPTIVAEAPPPPPMFVDAGTTIQSGQPAPPPGSQPPPPPGSPAPLDVNQSPQPVQQAGPAPAGAPSPIQQQASASQPSATSPQTKIGEVSDSGGGSKTTVSLSSVLSMIGSNQEKTAALEKSVVQAADAQAFSAGETAKATAEKIAGEAQSQSISISNSQSTSTVQTSGVQSFANPMQSGAVALQGNLQSNTVLNTARQEQANASANQQSSGSSGSSQQQTAISSATKQDSNMSFGYQFTLQTPKYEPPKFESSYTPPIAPVFQYQPSVARQEFNVAMVTPSSSYSLVTPTRPVQQVQIEMPSIEGIKFGHKSPVDNAMESKPMLTQMNTGSQQTETVKKNVQNNELAGGVSIESIAKQPANYAQYFTMIPDVAFYQPKEIYKNQKVIDNAKTLRGLQSGSDRLHQDMVNQQYK
jgi:hypothetical protein